jgi:SAM-dependent methyltransferase
MRTVELPKPDPSVHIVGANHSGNVGRLQMRLLKYCGLEPSSRIMEIGCGIGRLVYDLAPYLDTGAYAGFDIAPDAIDWLNENYKPLLPNFRFDLVEVHNARYRPGASDSAERTRFPYDDDSFDFSCSFSVFTHMQLPEIAHYLTELRRVLEPGGKGVMTFFAIGDRDLAKSEAPALDDKRSFEPMGDGVFTISTAVPEKGIAFREELIDSVIADAKLTTIDRFDGSWHKFEHTGPNPPFHKDVYVLSPA